MAYDLLLPAPRQASAAAGNFTLGPATGLRGEPGLTRIVRRLLGLDLYDSPDGRVSVRLEAGEPESYRLSVTPDGIEITGADEAGVRHAVQTLRQLMGSGAFRAAKQDEWQVPCGEVADRPAVEWRGMMLDVSRYFSTKRTVLKYIDLLAQHRMNRFHFHLTDDQGWRIESRKYPQINEKSTHRPATLAGNLRADDSTYDGTPHGGYYTLDDLAEISAYAAERGILVVPELDLPGHASALLAAFPELGTGEAKVQGHWGVLSGILKPIPASVKLICELIDEVLEVMDTPYVHLGGDECVTRDWATDPEVVAHRDAVGLSSSGELHGWFLREVAEHLATRGKRMIVWDEAFQTGGVRHDTIVMCWRGDAIGKAAAAAGYDVVRSPVYPAYLDYDQSNLPEEPLALGGPILLEDSCSFEVLPASWSDEERARVLGGQFNVWCEYIPNDRHLDYMVFPRGAALPDNTWNGGSAEHSDVVRRLTGAHFARLEAAGCEYRPLEGPLPWQQGGTGRRARHTGNRTWDTAQWHEWRDKVPDSGEVH
jgi:hexosaminidase